MRKIFLFLLVLIINYFPISNKIKYTAYESAEVAVNTSLYLEEGEIRLDETKFVSTFTYLIKVNLQNSFAYQMIKADYLHEDNRIHLQITYKQLVFENHFKFVVHY